MELLEFNFYSASLLYFYNKILKCNLKHILKEFVQFLELQRKENGILCKESMLRTAKAVLDFVNEAKNPRLLR